MSVDCQWIEKNLEALFCGTLNPEEKGIAQKHIEGCASCGKEVAAFNAIDPLIKQYFEGELKRAIRGAPVPSGVRRFRLIALSSAAVLAASLLLVVSLRTMHQNPAIPPASSPQQVTSSGEPQPGPLVKSTDDTNLERAKPDETTPVDQVPARSTIAAADKGLPEFLVSDVAGYSRTLNDYRGHVLVIGVLTAGQTDSIPNLERLYKVFGLNPKFRFLGVSDDHQPKPPNTTFPFAYNQGSRLFGAKPGDFVLLDEAGAVQLRGSLVKDFDTLQKALQER